MRPVRTRSARTVALFLFLVALGLSTVLAAQPAFANASQKPCNGSAQLCDRPFNEVTLPGSHNSMSAAGLGWNIPNQTYSIPHQLHRGARAMLIDTYYGKPNPEPTTWSSIVGVKPQNRDDPGVDMYLCHETCVWGATNLIEEFTRVRDFLAANPREVMVFVNEANVVPDDFARAMEESGLIDFIYTGPTDSWPTLEDMITSGQRVVMLSESGTGTVPWYHSAYGGTVQETPYDWPAGDQPSGVQMLTEPDLLEDSCRPKRGSTGSLFLMNHWVSGTPPSTIIPDPATAAIVNQKDVLVSRARACEQLRGIKPTILAVDFFGTGDVVGAARKLNGIAEPSPPTARLRIKKTSRAVVRAGQRAIFRMRIRNNGNAGATGVKVCTKVPKRLARKPRCVKVKVRAKSAVTARIKVQTKKRGKGRGKVKFIVRSSDSRPKKRSAKSTLRLKPARRHNSRR